MKKALILLALVLATQASIAACPSPDGEWLLQTAVRPSGAAKNKLLLEAGQITISISGNAVSLTNGLTNSISSSGKVELSYLNSGDGTVTVDDNTCRLTLSVEAKLTTFTGNGGSTSTTSLFSGQADYVNIYKGYSGKGRVKRGKKSIASTFNLVRS